LTPQSFSKHLEILISRIILPSSINILYVLGVVFLLFGFSM
jgi:hypothetical protein